MNIDKHKNTLLRVAEAIDNPVRCFRLAAGVIYRNDLVGLGINQYKTDPFQAKYSKNEKAIYLHAEISAIKNSLRFMHVEDFRKATLVIVRVKRKTANSPFLPAMSLPCEGCKRCIADFGIRNVLFTTDTGGFDSL